MCSCIVTFASRPTVKLWRRLTVVQCRMPITNNKTLKIRQFLERRVYSVLLRLLYINQYNETSYVILCSIMSLLTTVC